jgi:hypothetical protein
MRTSSGCRVRQRASAAVRRVLDINGFRKFFRAQPINYICGFHTRARASSCSRAAMAQPPTSSQGPLDAAVVALDAVDVLSDALVEDRVPRRPGRLWSDPVLAALSGVRSALAVAIATAWPTGATAVIIVATACSLLISLEQPVITTMALVRSDATHVPDDCELVIGITIRSEW